MTNVTVTSSGGGDVGPRQVQRGRGGRGGRGGVRVRGGTGRGRGRGRGGAGAGAIKVSTPGSYSLVVSKVFLFIFYARKTVPVTAIVIQRYLYRCPVLRIHDILGWIWIRIWIRGSMPLTN